MYEYISPLRLFILPKVEEVVEGRRCGWCEDKYNIWVSKTSEGEIYYYMYKMVSYKKGRNEGKTDSMADAARGAGAGL